MAVGAVLVEMPMTAGLIITPPREALIPVEAVAPALEMETLD
jgi:hypothetical protein